MSQLYWNAISENMRLVMTGFALSAIGSQFYLAGGTALALQLGHRRSVDLDFFSPNEDIPTIRPQLEKALKPYQAVLADSSWGNLVYLAQGVRLGFYGYGFPLVAPLVETERVCLASIEDIALMKLDALLSRAVRKDFYDLYFIFQVTSLRRLLDRAPQKYPSIRDFETQAVKRLVYFENAEAESDPELMKNASWEVVKDFFVRQAKEIEQGWLK